MTKNTANVWFEINVEELDLIESALIEKIRRCVDVDELDRIRTLLGDLHQQKSWLRPDTNPDGTPYISG